MQVLINFIISLFKTIVALLVELGFMQEDEAESILSHSAPWQIPKQHPNEKESLAQHTYYQGKRKATHSPASPSVPRSAYEHASLPWNATKSRKERKPDERIRKRNARQWRSCT